MAHLSRPFWGNTSKTIYYSSFLLCIHKVHVKTPVEASQPNKQSTIRPTRLDFAAFPVFFYLNCRWEVFWGQNSLCVDFQRDWSLSLGSSGESREERANSIALFPLDIWVKRSRICSFRSWKRSHFSAIYKQSSDSFKQLPLPSHCADGALQRRWWHFLEEFCHVSGEALMFERQFGPRREFDLWKIQRESFWFFQTSIIPFYSARICRATQFKKCGLQRVCFQFVL